MVVLLLISFVAVEVMNEMIMFLIVIVVVSIAVCECSLIIVGVAVTELFGGLDGLLSLDLCLAADS